MIALAVITALFVIALVVRERDHQGAVRDLIDAQQAERDKAVQERGVLLNRIQRPDMIPRSRGPVRQTPPEDRKPAPELHKVGLVASIAAGEHSEDEE